MLPHSCDNINNKIVASRGGGQGAIADPGAIGVQVYRQGAEAVAYPWEVSGERVPPEFDQEGMPMYFSPQISLNDSRGHT